MDTGSKVKRPVRWILGTAAGLAALAVTALVVLQIVLSPSVCTSIIKKYAPRFIEGQFEAKRIYVSVFSHFPAITANMEDLLVTYPAERFDSSEISGVRNRTVYAGTFRGRPGEVPMDTLASFERFSAALNLLSLMRGTINIKEIELVHPRAFLHFYADGKSNLDIIKLSGNKDDDKDTSSTGLPEIVVRRVRIGERARISWSDQRDTLMATMLLRNLNFGGRISTTEPLEHSFRIDLDTLLVSGNTGRDTLLFDLDHLDMDKKGRNMMVDASAKAYAATGAFGRIKVPVALHGHMSAEKDSAEVWNLDFRKVRLDLAGIRAQMDMSAKLDRRIYLDGNVSIPDLDVRGFLDEYGRNITELAGKINTDSHISANAGISGYYDPATGELPAFEASLDMGRCRLEYSDLPLHPELELHITASAGQGGPVNANIRKMSASAEGIDLEVSGNMDDALGKAPKINAGARLEADLGEFGEAMGDFLGMNLYGNLVADASGKLNLKTFSLYNPESFDLKAKMELADVRARSFDDSLNIYSDRLNLAVALMEDRFKLSPDKDAKALGAVLKADSLVFLYKDAINVTGKKIDLLAQSSPVRMDLNDGQKYNPVHAMLTMDRLFFEGKDSLSIRLLKSRNNLKLSPDRKNPSVPVLSIKSDNGMVMARTGVHRAMIKNLGFLADARMNTALQERKRIKPDTAAIRRFLKSPANNLNRQLRRDEADFRKADIHIDLGESFRKYFTNWNMNGTLKMDRGVIATPAFPLRTAITGFKGTFSNDAVTLDTLRIRSGASNLAARGKVSNLRRVLTSNGTIRLNLDLNTDSLAVSELLNAYAQGQSNMKTDLAYLAGIDDSAYEETVTEVGEDSAATSALIVIPANVDADVRINGKGVKISSLDIRSISGSVIMKDRCLQLNNAVAHTTVGKVSADAFYSTRTKKDIWAGFDLDLKEVAAGDVIDMLPTIDSLMPLLKSFDGKLDCNLAATAQLDTNMNFITPSMEGVIRIGGTDLHFHDNKQIARVARMLMFKQPERATVDSMTIEGILKDGSLEIFPFLMKMDRWTVAFAGVQNIDQSFHYHVSLARTPLLLKLGANIFGDDFDHMNFKLGKAQYRDVRKIPSFSQMIDTTRVNLVSSIKSIFVKGVKQAVNENRARQAEFAKERVKAGYTRSIAFENLEALSSGEQSRLDSLTYSQHISVEE